MLIITNFTFALLVLITHQCLAYDDGKYHPRKYNIYDDGKYYRPLDEGKYIPGDEGKYTYVYKQGLYPLFPYVHVVGPNGGFGGNGGYGGNGGNGHGGGYGPNGPNGPGGPGGPNGPDGPDNREKIVYIGKKIYAERYPYMHRLIKALINKYVSLDSLFGEESEGSANHYLKVFSDKETAVKCQYLKPNSDDNTDDEEFTTEYPLDQESENTGKFGTFYSFKGTKTISNVTTPSLKSTLRLEYEVIVRIVDEVTN